MCTPPMLQTTVPLVIGKSPASCLSDGSSEPICIPASDSTMTFDEMNCNIVVAIADRFRTQMLQDENCSGDVDLLEISDWLHMLLTKAQCAPGVLIVAYIYCLRLLGQNELVNITMDNWKSITLTAILLASKVWDDLSMMNGDFAYITKFALQQINDWERAFLKGLRYNIQVQCNDYEKHFFDLRAHNIPKDLRDECEKRYNVKFETQRPSSLSKTFAFDIHSISPATSISINSMEMSPSILDS